MDETLQFFDLLTAGDVTWILDRCEARTILAEQVLITVGSKPSHLYFVSQGQFDVFVSGLSGSVNRLQLGALIGEVSWIERSTATATP